MRRSWPLATMAAVSLVSIVVLTASTGCVRVPLDRETGEFSQAAERVEVGDAERADVRVSMGAGELFIDSGTAERGTLLDADYTFRPASWEPEVTYEVRGDRGVLEVRQPRVSGLPNLGRGVTNRWELALTDEIPLALEVNLGAGKSELVLGGLDLRELDVSTGAGDVLVDLVGPRTEDLRATVEGGAGAFRVRVPADVGVRVIGVRDGLGAFEVDGFVRDGDDYVNSAYGRSAATIELRISRGVGETVIEEVD